jgi:hypothetical protein
MLCSVADSLLGSRIPYRTQPAVDRLFVCRGCNSCSFLRKGSGCSTRADQTPYLLDSTRVGPPEFLA